MQVLCININTNIYFIFYSEIKKSVRYYTAIIVILIDILSIINQRSLCDIYTPNTPIN